MFYIYIYIYIYVSVRLARKFLTCVVALIQTGLSLSLSLSRQSILSVP